MQTNARYPLGTFTPRSAVGPEERAGLIEELAALPRALRKALSSSGPVQLDTPYREDGWTLRQVVHHVADSHMNAFIRFKLALTEDRPRIKPYDEAAWALLSDSELPIEPSLQLIEALHERWAKLLRALRTEQWSRVYVHPELGDVPLDLALQLYAWHGRHHLAHIARTLELYGAPGPAAGRHPAKPDTP